MTMQEPPPDELSFVRQVMFLFDSADIHSEMYWHVGDDGIRLLALVSDVFMWGCADAEDITPERLPVLQQAYDDLAVVDGLPHLAELYAARIRRMRPQGAAYSDSPGVRFLFDKCGPERETGLGNPKAPAPLAESEAARG
jgi:hypothetical protein